MSHLIRVTGLFLVGLWVAGCGDSPTAPTETTTTTTTTTAAATVSEDFDGIVPTGGSAFYSFSFAQSGTVALRLVAVSGTVVPSTVMLGVGIGTPSGTDCTTTSTITTAAGASAQLTGTYAAGVYCAKVFDVGNLFGPATFTLNIAHP